MEDQFQKSINEQILAPKYGDTEYLKKVSELLYQSSDIETSESAVQSIPLPKGVCAHVFGPSEVAWFCKVCGKDENCIMCQDCFEHSSHAGHPVYLERSVAGCCDCGDPEAWDAKGFCTAHQGFISESKAGPDQLPALVRHSAPIVVEALCSRFFSVCNMLGTFRGKQEDPEILAKTQLTKEISGLTMVLSRIAETSPIFLYLVCRSMSKERENCTVEEDGKERYKLTFSTPVSALDTLMEMCDEIQSDVAEKIGNFLTGLIKSHDFKYSLGKTFLMHYVKINSGAGKSFAFSSLSVQCIGMEEFAVTVFREYKYVEKMLEAFRVTLTGVTAENIKERRIRITLAVTDFKYMLHESSVPVLLKTNFLSDLITVSGNYSYAARLPMLKQHVEYDQPVYTAAAEIELELLQLFKKIAKAVDYSDTVFCRKIADTFRILMYQLNDAAKASKDSFYNIPVHRFLAYFLTSYVQFQLLLSGCARSETGQATRGILKDLFGIASDPDFDKFLMVCLFPVLRTVGFFLEGQASKWNFHGRFLEAVVAAYSSYSFPLAKYDLMLVDVLLTASSPDGKSALSSFLMLSISQDDGWLSTYVGLLVDESKTQVQIAEMLKAAQIDYEKCVAILERTLYLLSGICSNDCLSLLTILSTSRSKFARHKFLYSLKEQVEALKHRAIRRELVHAYFAQKKSWVEFKKIYKNVPRGFGSEDEVLAGLKEIADCSKDAQKGFDIYRVKDEYFGTYDPYYYLMQGSGHDADEIAGEVHKKVRNPSKFNPLFGRAVKDDCVAIDLSAAVSRTLAGTNLPAIVRKLILRGSKGELSNNATISALKLLRCMKDHLSVSYLNECRSEIQQCTKRLQEGMTEYADVFAEFAAELEKSETSPTSHTSSPSSAVAAEKSALRSKQMRVMEEFKKRSEHFATRNQEELKGMVPAEAEVACCVVCREPLTPASFQERPYGKFFHCSESNVYLNYMKQHLGKERWPELKSLGEGLALSTCGHYVHSQCADKLVPAEKNEVMMAVQAILHEGHFIISTDAVSKCPLCKSPYVFMFPPAECVQRLLAEKPTGCDLVEGFANRLVEAYQKLREEKYQKKGKKLGFSDMYKVLNRLMDYAVRTSEIADMNTVLAKKEIFQSLFYSSVWLLRAKSDSSVAGKAAVEGLAKAGSRIAALGEKGTLVGRDMRRDMIFTLLQLKLGHGEEVPAGRVVSFYLYLYLWQLAVCLLQHDGVKSLSDPKAALEFIRGKEPELKLLATRWLRSAICIKDILFPGTVSAESLKLISKFTFDELCVGFLGHSDTSLQSFLMAPPADPLPSVLIPTGVVAPEKLLAGARARLSNALPVELETIFAVASGKGFSLVQLEENFTDCVKVHYKRKCKNCGKQIKRNALCLVCGEILCPGTRCCHQDKRGELTCHSAECGKDKGMYLIFAENEVLLMSDGFCVHHPSFYLNARGESVNTACKTFETIRLDMGKLNELKMMYLQDRIPAVVEALKSSGKMVSGPMAV